MSKELVISATPHETRVAIVEDGQLCEIYIEREREFALVGSLYKGRVTRVLPGMQSSFVDIGLDSDAFLYVSDFLEHLEDYDHVAPAAATKIQKTGPPANEVFAPPTHGGPINAGAGNGGAAHEPKADALPPSQDHGSIDAVPAAEAEPSALPADVKPAPPVQQTQRPYEQRPDRGRGSFNDRGGRNRRWGRQGGGRDRRPGRDLPSSKYASTRPTDSRPRETQPYEPPPADYVPVILPGESLAKYKDRIPAAPPATPRETPSEASRPEAESQATATTGSTYAQTAGGLPGSLYAIPPVAVPVENQSPAEEPQAPFVASPPSITGEIKEETKPETKQETARLDSEREIADEAEAAPQVGSALSDDEMAAFSEQLAEAKHEEAQEDAEADEAGIAPFVEEAELEELEDELHEDQIEEAEATADEMHDEALAAEPSLDHVEEQLEDHVEDHGAVETSLAPESQPSGPSGARISDQPRARFQRPMRRWGRQRGGRRSGPPSQEHRPYRRPQQQRRPQLISEMLKAGQEIIVQIAKEPLGKKGARITSHVALPGRFLVYMPTVDHIGVSHRIGSAEDRSRLRRVVNEAKGTFPGGFIVRTAAAGASDEEIRTDVEFLGRTWDTIRTSAEQRHAPTLLHRDLNLVERILRDYMSDDYVAIWIDNQEEYGKVVEFISRFQPKMVGRVKLYTKESPIFEEFGIQQELDKALRPKVWLKSGGHIVINHTEALVAIDVNTGKYVGRGSTRLEDTIVKTNLEAVKEIVRQIRLRDLGGIIVLDLIDMEERRNREKVLFALEQALSQDRAPSKALAFNEFGLVCITRKRTKQALERVLCQPCPYCTGSGMVKSIPTICYEIQSEARKMSADIDAQSLTLRVNPEIAKSLKTRESSLIEELEQATRKSIIIQSDPTLHWEQYDIY